MGRAATERGNDKSHASSASQYGQVERKAGSIVRVTCRDFLTYRHMVVWPTPGLNLIIGPNGSGKSSLAAAIGLALGGTPKHVGRGCETSQFIRHGCESAEIEVELYNPDGDNWIIERRIRQGEDDSRNKTKSLCNSKINGKTASYLQVKTLTESLNIQIGNLVQFLPQERVAEFAKMNSQELLLSTEKTLSTEEDLYALHEDLMKSKTDWTAQETDIQRTERDLVNFQRDLPSLEEQFERFKQRNEQEAEFALLRKIQRYLSYETKRCGWLRQRQSKCSWNKEYTKTLKDSRTLLLELKKADEAATASTQQASGSRRRASVAAPASGSLDISTCKAQASKVSNLNAQATKRVADENKNFEAYFEKINSVNVKYEEEQKRQENRKKREAQLLGQIKDVESSIILSQKMTVEQIKQQETALAKEETELKKQKDALTQEMSKKQEEKEKKKQACTAKQSEIEAILQLLRRKELHIQSVNEDVYKAYVTIRKYMQHESNPFKGHVYGPLFSEIKPIDAAHETILESAIPFRDLIGFLCEDKQDLKLLQDRLVDQNRLRINLFLILDDDGADPYRHPVPINTLKLFDFTNYVSDLFDAPPAVKYFLTRTHMLAQQPVALKSDPKKLDAVVNAIQQIENKRASQSANAGSMRVPRFFFGDRRYEMNRSKYSGEMFTRSMQLPAKSQVVKYFESEQHHIAKSDRLKQDIADLQVQVKDYDAELAELKAQGEEYSKKIDALKRDRMKLRSLKEDRDRFEKQKSQFEKQLIDVQKSFVDLDAVKLRCDDERDRHTASIFDTFGKLDYISSHVDENNNTMLAKIDAVFDSYVEITKQTWVQKDKQEKAREQVQKMKEIRGARTNFADRMQKQESEVAQAFTEFIANAYRGKDGAPSSALPAGGVPMQSGPRRTQFLLNPPLPKDEQLLKWRTEHKLAQKNNGKSVQRVAASVDFEALAQDVHDKCTTCRLNLDDLRSVQNVESKLLNVRAEITRLSGRLETLKAELDEARESAGGKRKTWLDAINGVLSKLHDTFSDAMKRIGCRGGIELDIPEDVDDFAKYGVKLSVAYRNTQQLHKLDACYQSGGERSVATALYLVALMRYTKCPFRCVDEINQGMDSTNERKVFDLLVEAAREDSGQYFVLTPKVLRGLNYGRDMNIIAVAHMKAGQASSQSTNDEASQARSSDYPMLLPPSANDRLSVPKFSQQQLAVYKRANASISALVSGINTRAG